MPLKKKPYYFVATFRKVVDGFEQERCRRGSFKAMSAADAGDAVEDMADKEWNVKLRRIEIFGINEDGVVDKEPRLIYSQYDVQGKLSDDWDDDYDPYNYDPTGTYNNASNFWPEWGTLFTPPQYQPFKP